MVNSNSKKFAKSSPFSSLFLLVVFCFFLLFAYQFSHQFFVHKYLTIKFNNTTLKQHQYQEEQVPAAQASVFDPCTGRYIYVYDLPDRFNFRIIQHCQNLSRTSDVCKHVTNSGLGPKLVDTSSTLPETGWYVTDQFMLEIIFHNSMKQYECLTTDYSKSTAVYIPYYIGLGIMQYLFGYSASQRDALINDFLHWLRARPEWAARGGRDHFMVIGRVAWDFFRTTNESKRWGGKFLTLPEAKNMTLLFIETSNMHENEFGIPYPTYFHPSEKSQVVAWQEQLRSKTRPWLFSFAGKRHPNGIATMRDLIMDQCANATRCNLHECGTGTQDCHSPSNILGLFMSSIFCLQPPGDSPTRKSTFDSMVAGCIPVFFHPGSAYKQYYWYLPSNFNKYSVYIPEKAVLEGTVRIEDVLLGYSDEQINEMRENILAMIPTLVYKDPRNKSDDIRDAFDVTVDGVLRRIHSRNVL
ncbi:xyloglucan galactosyltransferase KATAMARI1 [Carex littledalei]|uniref:Xyloglucan galactosyltransferase KATAMARI1 n=1 Tax=Carex littledalei TaxID=544730 RepID=A0A833VHH1_9POAL|nr:xyloglucan galactosyltransferase KATAMARI1 [Carex littledalei]